MEELTVTTKMRVEILDAPSAMAITTIRKIIKIVEQNLEVDFNKRPLSFCLYNFHGGHIDILKKKGIKVKVLELSPPI